MNRLSAAHKNQLAEIVERRLAQAVSTTPADRPTVEAAVRDAYESTGLPAPRIVWCESPAAVGAFFSDATNRPLLASVMDSVLDSVWASVRDLAWDSVLDSVWASVRTSVGDSVWASVWASVRASVRDSVWASSRDSVGDSVWDAVWDSVWDSVWSAARARVRESACIECVALNGVEIPRRWYALDAISAAVVAWWPLKGVCVLLDRPAAIRHDASGRLHALNAPALEWRDGTKEWRIHDVRVAEEIACGRFSARDIDTEDNAEVRRVMLDMYGVERYLLDTKTEPVCEDKFGALYRRDMGDDEPLQVVRVVNSTPEPDGTHKHYWLRVPPDVHTPREAVAWTFGLSAADYAPEVET